MRVFFQAVDVLPYHVAKSGSSCHDLSLCAKNNGEVQYFCTFFVKTSDVMIQR